MSIKYRLALILGLGLLFYQSLYSQNKVFFNRIHYFEHQECQHPIGTVVEDKVYYANNADNRVFMNFFNFKGEVAFVELTSYGRYIAFNQFVKKDFVPANAILMGYTQGVPAPVESRKEARRKFRIKKVKDSIIGNKTLKHIMIEPKDTLVHRFKSYNLLINTNTETELPLYRSPSVYFLMLPSLRTLKGTVVESFYVDLEGYLFCRDVLRRLQITNKRVYIK